MITKEWIAEQRQRSQMAESVTLPIEQWFLLLDEMEELRGVKAQLVEGVNLLLNFVPLWALEASTGLCASMYGTGTADGDRVIKQRVDAIAASAVSEVSELRRKLVEGNKG